MEKAKSVVTEKLTYRNFGGRFFGKTGKWIDVAKDMYDSIDFTNPESIQHWLGGIELLRDIMYEHYLKQEKVGFEVRNEWKMDQISINEELAQLHMMNSIVSSLKARIIPEENIPLRLNPNFRGITDFDKTKFARYNEEDESHPTRWKPEWNKNWGVVECIS